MFAKRTDSTSSLVRAARRTAVGLIAVVLVACGQPSPEKLMTSAKEHLAKGDRNAAVIELKNLLQQAPNNGEARLILGQALFDAEDYVSAEKELSRALELKQPHERVVPTYALTLLALGKNQAVVTEVEKYKLFDPAALAPSQTALGDAYLRLGNAGRAGEAYGAALAAVPDYSRARLGKAILVAAAGQLDDALKQTDEIVGADPKLAEAQSFRADILMAKGDRAGAKKSLEGAIAANDRYLPARLTLITMLTDERDFEGAAKLIDSTRKIAPGDLRVTYRDAVLAYRKGDLERARQQSQQVLKYLPDDVLALLLAGSIEIEAKQFVAAQALLHKAIAKAPNNLAARRLLVESYLRTGQPVKAKEMLQPLVERGIPSDPQLQLLAGETFLASGDVGRATIFFREAAKAESSQQAAARLRLGQVALATGRSEQGFAELESASALDAGSYRADLALISGYMERKEYDKAMAAVRALEKKQPTNPLTFQMYGLVNLARRDSDAARKSFEKALELQANYLPSAYQLAQLDLSQNKPEDARKRYEAMIAKEPNNEQPYIALADLYARTGASKADTTALLRRAVKANPQASDARLALISALMVAGETKEALAAAQEALAAIPSDPRILSAAGAAQEAAGEVNQAIGTYNKQASLQPQAVQPLYRLASLYLRQKDTDKALETLRRVQKIVLRERDVVPQITQVLVAAGRYEEAFKEVRALQKRDPKFVGGYALEGDVYFEQKKYAEAERAYRDALKLDPNANAVAIKLHGVLTAAGRPAEAGAWAKDWIAKHPKDAAMPLYLADRELQAKNLKPAAEYYRTVVKLEPNNAGALNNLAWIGGQVGDPMAIKYAERAVRLAPGDASVIDTYGMLLVKQGKADEALYFLERAHKIAPARKDIHLNYARALIKAGKKNEASKELNLLKSAPENFAGKEDLPALMKEL